jgi:malonyl-CoA O-methyltransferase
MTGPGPPRPGVFVTGTDTGIGKTLVSACLVRAWDAVYWKPVQTGLAEETGDTATVATLADVPPDRLLTPRHALQAPLSPQAAAALEGLAITLDDFVPPAITVTGGRPLVVEGAGGVLVPLSDTALMIDLMARLELPVVVVARTGLGTINHTLLTLAALRARRLTVAGVILSGPPNPGNRAAIERFGAVAVLAELPLLPRVDADVVTRLATERVPPLFSLLP